MLTCNLIPTRRMHTCKWSGFLDSQVMKMPCFVSSRSGTDNDGHEICLKGIKKKMKRKEGWIHLPWVQFFQSVI